MKDLKKRVAVLMAAMVLGLTMGMPNVMTVKAAEYMPMAARTWVHYGCGGKLEVSVSKRIRVESEVKCTDYRHSPTCFVCDVIYLDVYIITCASCGESREQDTVETGKGTLHLDK